jgi:methyl-accepting chemotaxis protein
MNGKISIATRLWLSIGGFAVVMMGVFGLVAWRSSQITHDYQVATERLGRISALSARWAGLTETNVQRIVAAVVANDATVEHHFAPEIKATSALISGLQKEIDGLATSDAEKAQLAKVAAARDTYISARKEAVALRAKGDGEGAMAKLRGVVMPAVASYLGEQRALVDLEQRLSVEEASIFAQARLNTVYLAGGVVAFVLAAMALGGVLLVRSIVRPLQEAGAVSRRIGQGDLTAAVDTARGDEIGELLRAVAEMRDSLRNVVTKVRESTDSIQVASSEVAQGNTDLSHRTEQAASSLQQTASAMEELTGTVRQTADSARTASQLGASASSVAARGGSVVAQVVSTMDEINTSSRKIADITSVIDGIAFQTNILALNAAVEAARAGEQGRGFAVVAGEVRSLAQRSAEAAREIKTLIGTSVDKVESGARLVGEAGSTMTEIVSSVQRVTDIIGEISAAAEEQSTGIGSINGTVIQLDQATQQNAALVEESAAAAESLREQASQLAALVSGFKVGSENFDSPRKLTEQVLHQVAAQSSRPSGTVARAPAAKAPAPAPAKRSSSPPAAPRSASTATATATAAVTAPAPTPAPAPAAGPAVKSKAKAASTPVSDDDWETF